MTTEPLTTVEKDVARQVAALEYMQGALERWKARRLPAQK